jgi:hypothetical protein
VKAQEGAVAVDKGAITEEKTLESDANDISKAEESPKAVKTDESAAKVGEESEEIPGEATAGKIAPTEVETGEFCFVQATTRAAESPTPARSSEKETTVATVSEEKIVSIDDSSTTTPSAPPNVEPTGLKAPASPETSGDAEGAASADVGTSPNKRGFDEIKPAISRHFSELGLPAKSVSDTAEEDPPIESELFESRQQFLNYCQKTHRQFDELRRAKHSTVMVLYQLHNPTAPTFLQQCSACYNDITHGTRYHCNDCVNFELCQDCYEPVTSGLWAKRDARFAHDKTHTFTPVDMERAEETQMTRKEREQSLKAHVKLLEHAGTCEGPPECSLHNCQRMKKLFEHVHSCDVKPKRDCKICTRLLALCTIHSRMCTARDACPIPFCDRIRERNKRLRRQQQLMDDRRRQAQNELYHAG